jgi:hypothetical protein
VPDVRLIEHATAMAVVRLPAGTPAPPWAVGAPLVNISFTDEETSVTCPTSALPDEVPGPVEGPFVVFRIAGTLDFSQVGVLTSLLRPLADAGVPVVVMSTFDTDWIMVRSHFVAASESVWRAAGHEIVKVGKETAV